MSFFNKVLASVGIGATKVNAVLDKNAYMPGETVSGNILIEGGKTEQKVDRIYFEVMTEVVREHDDKKAYYNVSLGNFDLTKQTLVIKPDDKMTIPFSFVMPLNLPVTLGRTKVWIYTGLDVDMAIDPSDKDYLQILPHPLVKTVMDAVSLLGFRLREAECEDNRFGWLKNYSRVVQELEYVPQTEFRGKLDELEVSCIVTDNNQAEVVMQIDRKVRGLKSLLMESAGLDETYVRFAVTKQDTAQVVAQKIQNIIQSKL